jgi:predicted dehydrogenase
MIKNLWLIGAGPMAMEYAKVLDTLDITYEVIGRGEASASEFGKKCVHSVRTGGLKKWVDQKEISIPATAIVAVGVEQLAAATIDLLKNDVKHILVEKPAGLTAKEISEVANITKEHNTNVYIAYNRRFYASVQKAREIIADDGGVTSFNFEFTEWSHEIKNLNKAPSVKENWLLGNSSHVIDLAFFLGGKPKEITCYTAGGLGWHPSASIFSGAGVSETGALFNYQANWESAGRWGVEILTKEHRLIFLPLEKLQRQNIGSVDKEFVKLDYELDKKFKPGLYRQTKAFLRKDYFGLCSIDEQCSNVIFYNKILTG